MMNNKKKSKMILLTIMSSLMTSFALKIIIFNSKFISTGFSGVASLFSKAFSNNQAIIYSLVYLVINFFIFLLAYKKVNKNYALFSFLHVVFHALFVMLWPNQLFNILQLNEINNDLMMAILAGIIVGFAGSVVYSNGFSFGESDTVSNYINKKQNRLNNNFEMYFNILVLTSAVLFLQNVANLVVYTMIYIFIKSLTINFFYVRNKKVLLQIVSKKGEEIANTLIESTKYTCTIYNAIGAYSKKIQKELSLVIYYSEFKETIKMIKKIDPESFVTVLEVRNSYGGNFSSKGVGKNV